MNKIYVKEINYKDVPSKYKLLEFLLKTVVYAFVLMICANIFRALYIESFWYAIIASLIISLLNITIKPFLVAVTLPITIYTVGLFYPVINLIILKLVSLILGNSFSIKGIIVPIIIVLFISFLNIIFDNLITKPIMRRTK